MGIKNYKRLKVWEKSIELVVDIYRITESFPNSEQYGLISQVRRCSVSVPSNIAEGAGRQSEKEFNHFFNIAKGSTNELETQLIISQRLKFITEDDFNDCITKIEELQKMISGLQKSLTANS
ncbi:four helix bundle protein [Sunxiuqinia sp. A32]|uniref:four helix bundle protein n=1 Tax=Sunxiuqinia sp. A32 TaxID=3461496 RepID=UPI00404644DD